LTKNEKGKSLKWNLSQLRIKHWKKSSFYIFPKEQYCQVLSFLVEKHIINTHQNGKKTDTVKPVIGYTWPKSPYAGGRPVQSHLRTIALFWPSVNHKIFSGQLRIETRPGPYSPFSPPQASSCHSVSSMHWFDKHSGIASAFKPCFLKTTLPSGIVVEYFEECWKNMKNGRLRQLHNAVPSQNIMVSVVLCRWSRKTGWK